jgi:hypothetical protein
VIQPRDERRNEGQENKRVGKNKKKHVNFYAKESEIK